VTKTLDRVRLRDVTLEDADMLDAWEGEVRGGGGFNDLGQEPHPIDRDALARGPLRNERNGLLIVELSADGSPIGHVSWRRVSYGPTDRSEAWSIGIELRPTARGQGYGSEAQRLVAAYLFATTDANRVEASTDVENLAEQRALERAGYRREGVTRGAQYRAGSYHDLVTYAVLRDDILT
jgi:RimJ/RimL family protein N-acetyltransferase